MSANRLTVLQHISQNSFWSNNDWIFSDISQLSAIWTFCITAEVELGSPRSVRMAAAPAAVTGRSVSRSWPGCWLVAATAHARTQVNPVLRNPRTRKLNYTGTFYEKWECILLILKIHFWLRQDHKESNLCSSGLNLSEAIRCFSDVYQLFV